jgi:Type IV secretion system pilin
MKKTITQTVSRIGIGVTASLAVATSYASEIFASPASQQLINGSNSTGQQGGTTFQQGVQTVTNMLLFLIGVIAVIAIIMGGIRYTTSNGDASQTKAAKDTILYAVVGLIVAIMAYAVVSWVIRVFV